MSGVLDFDIRPMAKSAVAHIYVAMRHGPISIHWRNEDCVHTTKMRPRSFAAVHFRVYPSFLYVGLAPASSA